MTRERDESLKGGIKGDRARRERLASALRENLKRRKTLERARSRVARASGKSPDKAPGDGNAT